MRKAVILVAALVLLGVAIFGLSYHESYRQNFYELESASSQTIDTFCVADEETRERIRNIMIEALDEALHDQIKTLFIVWMKDERGQPDRARVGARAAIKAHQSARKNAVEWMPQICGN